MTIEIRYKVIPSFSDEILINIDELNDGENWIKQKYHDKKELKPELVNIKQLNQLLYELKKIRLFPLPEFALGLDGTSYELEISNGFNKVQFHWWGNLPTEWQPLQALTNHFDEIIKKVPPEYLRT